MVAAEHGETKANPNHQNQDDETALMKACAEGVIESVKILIKSDKTDYKIMDVLGCIETLIKHKAMLNVLINMVLHRGPLMVAAEHGETKAVEPSKSR